MSTLTNEKRSEALEELSLSITDGAYIGFEQFLVLFLESTNKIKKLDLNFNCKYQPNYYY